ncbi:MAG: M56 family metallopeptidase, partial [Rhodothermales bacterium]
MEILPSYTAFVTYGVSLFLKASVILAAAWFLSGALRRRSAGLRHVLWSTAVAAILVLPLVSAWMPAIEVDVSHFETLKQRVLTTSKTVSGNAVEMPIATGDGTSRLVETPVRQSDIEDEVAAVPVRSRNGVVYAFFVWLAGGVGLAAVFLIHLARIRSVTRNAVSKQCIDQVAAAVWTEIGHVRETRVLVGQVEMPVTWGLFRPVVLLPVEAIEWDERRLRMVLMHELAHIRRRDYLPHLIAELSCIAYWPNPLVWVARHRLRAE